MTVGSPPRPIPTAWLREALDLGEGETPFPWQETLLASFTREKIPAALDIPTGLGKTAVMAIWLVARASGAKLPRRLVYVVDRRAVVDQATEVALNLRSWVERRQDVQAALGLGGRALPISTLRGRYVDNREWLEDPAIPAIVVGTVDMVGSRFLFEGYGVSRKMRPYHAGLLGTDVLLVLDEAHLVPPFERLIETISTGDAEFGPRGVAIATMPRLKLLSLSATGGWKAGMGASLTTGDYRHPVVKRRLNASKRLTFCWLKGESGGGLAQELVKRAWELGNRGKHPARILVYCDKRKDAESVMEGIKKRLKQKRWKDDRVELLVGGRRIFEREEALQRLKELGFVAGDHEQSGQPAFLIATSAGEVGVDLDADHMVSDLVAWERMVQRLGRVNRRGGDTRKAEVIVVCQQEGGKGKAAKQTKKNAEAEADKARKRAVRKLLGRLPSGDGGKTVSPGALHDLKQKAVKEAALRKLFDEATTPLPLRPALSRALVEAWSMTSLREHTGRPEVGPWLRGWERGDPPQTTTVWRKYLPVRQGEDGTDSQAIEQFFEAAPPHASEMLETETYRVVEWLLARAKALKEPEKAGRQRALDGADRPGAGSMPGVDDVVAIALSPAGDLRAKFSVKDLTTGDIKEQKALEEGLKRTLAGATFVVDSRLGGLMAGLLDAESEEVPRTADDGKPWLGNPGEPVVRFQVRDVRAGEGSPSRGNWRQRHRFAAELTEDGIPVRWLIVEKWGGDAATEEDRSEGVPQSLAEHQAQTAQRARQLAERLGLPEEYSRMIEAAARLHDEGKKAPRWQRAFNAPRGGGPYAKTAGPLNLNLLDGYRHEFGSVADAEHVGALAALPPDLRDLALHLIAAHHGFARPVIETRGCEDAPPSALEDRAREVALRFARLQKRWGPWGLAWWEALLRAADQQASRDHGATPAGAAQETA